MSEPTQTEYRAMMSGVPEHRPDSEIISNRPLDVCLEVVKSYRAQGYRAWVESRTVTAWAAITTPETDAEDAEINRLAEVLQKESSTGRVLASFMPLARSLYRAGVRPPTP